MVLVSRPPNAIIMQQGAVGSACYVVLSGSCDVYKLRDPSQPRLKEHTMFVREAPPEHVPAAAATKDAEHPTGVGFAALLAKVAYLTKHSKEMGALLDGGPDKIGDVPSAPFRAARPAGPPSAACTYSASLGKGKSDVRKRVARVGTMLTAAASAASIPSAAPTTTTSDSTGEPGPADFVGPFQRDALGELVVTVEEGDVIGELSLFRSDARRAGMPDVTLLNVVCSNSVRYIKNMCNCKRGMRTV